MIEVVVSLMSNCLVQTPCGIEATRLVLASVGIIVLNLDECCIYRQAADTILIRLCGAIAVSDAGFQLIASEPSRRVDNLFKLLEIDVHIREIYVIFDGKKEVVRCR